MTSAAAIPSVTLNDDHTMPVIGLGVGELSDAETEPAVSAALDAGYRLIDTAAAYGNEAAVGRAIASSGVPREELFVTTKLATEDQGFQSSQDALAASLERLGLDYVDLYLIHWPAGEQGKYIDSWGGLLAVGGLATPGRSAWPTSTRSICRTSSTCPSSPLSSTRSSCTRCSIRRRCAPSTPPAMSSRRPTARWASAGFSTTRPIVSVAESHGKTPAQVLIRWSIQLGNVVIPRSSSPERVKANLDVFDFELTDDEMATLNGLDDGTRFRPDPETYTGT